MSFGSEECQDEESMKVETFTEHPEVICHQEILDKYMENLTPWLQDEEK